MTTVTHYNDNYHYKYDSGDVDDHDVNYNIVQYATEEENQVGIIIIMQNTASFSSLTG